MTQKPSPSAIIDAIKNQPPAYDYSQAAPMPKAVKLEKNTQGGFTGAAFIIFGFLLLFAWPFGTLIGVILLIAGCCIGNGYRCGACGNKIDSKQVKMCPTCKASLSP